MRWFKGWLQTWLLTMRSPRRLWREMGGRAFLISQLLISGMLLSALVHPLVLAFAISVPIRLSLDPTYLHQPAAVALATVDIINMIGSYIALLSLGFSAMAPAERRKVGHAWLWLPVYWLMISAPPGGPWRISTVGPSCGTRRPMCPAPRHRSRRRGNEQAMKQTGAGSGNRTRAFSLGS